MRNEQKKKQLKKKKKSKDVKLKKIGTQRCIEDLKVLYW